jgi:hypothetical protein
MAVILDLSGSNKLFSVETRNKLQDEIFYFIRLCSYNSNSTNMFDTVCVSIMEELTDWLTDWLTDK